MKSILVSLTAATGLLLFSAMPLPAAPRGGKGDVAAMMKDPAMARAALHAMMQDPDTKRMMARELAKDSEFRRLYATETGSNAPHQERNPSDHPELFQGRRKPESR